jgi:acyl-CoA thioesterase-2
MGDFGVETAVEACGDGRYDAVLHSDWEIWGPMGGYVAAVVTRALGAEASHTRPASFYCHYLRAARFGPIEVQVTTLRRGRSAESLRAIVTQEDRQVMDATMSVVRENEGLEHEVAPFPSVPPPDALGSLADFFAEEDVPPPATPWWSNFDARPVEPRRDWPPMEAKAPEWHQWHRFVPTSTFDDQWTDAARYVLLCDLPSWPATVPHHAWKWGGQPIPWTAPTLDLYVAFHRPVPDEPWLLVEGRVPIAADGLLGCATRVWSSSGQLVASGGGQGFFRRMGPPS